MKNPENSIQNFTNSGLEQVSFNKGDIIYQFNEQPKVCLLCLHWQYKYY